MSATGSTEGLFSVRLVGPSDGEEVSNETLKEEPSREMIVRVDLFTVVVTFAVLLTLISVGTVANVAVLVVLKYRKRVQAAVRRDAALCNMSVVHLLICLVLAPIEFATVAESYVKHSLPAYVCLARDCGFHLLIAALVTAVVLAAVCQTRRLSADRTPSRWREALTVLQFTVPWIVGACAAATSVSTRLLTSLGFEVCRKSIAFWERVGGGEGADPWQLDLVLGPVYFLALCVALLWLVVVVVVARRRRSRSFEEAEKREAECLASAKESRKMKLIKDGGDGGQPDNRTSGLKDPSPSSSTNPGGKLNSRITAGGNQKPPDSQENEEAEETDDVFDLKMRTEFENKSRSSGRRHTVANIGLPDLEDLRSASSPFGGRVDDGSGGSRHRSQTRHPSSSSSSTKKTPEYHYVRKWSVDITALANQLENPKAHSDTSPFKEKADENNAYEEAIKGLQAPSNACIVASCEYIGPPGGGTTEKSPGAGDDVREAPGKVRPSSRNGGKETAAGRREFREKSGRSGIEEKRIVTKDVSTRQEIELSLDSGTKEPSVGGADERGAATAAARPGPSRDTAKMARELTTLTKMLVLVAVSLLLAGPCFVLFVWFSVSPVQDLHLGYNLSVASEMIVMLQAAVNPVLLLWVDQRLRRRARRLLAEASHLRCVCYCNVSRQGNCLRPPQKASVALRERTADEKAPLKA